MNLTIFNIQNHEPVLVLNEDNYGLKVVGGDPKMVETLGLSRFRDLKEIADYINSAGDGFQAAFDDPAQGSQKEEPTLDDRVKPSLEILKELMSRVSERQNQDKAKEESEKNEAEMLQSTDSQVIQADNGPIYVSLDGDNIGNAVARAEEKDDEAALAEISGRINAGQDVLKDWARRMGGTVVEQGGDEGLVKVPSSAKEHIEELREQYRSIVGATASVGVGKKISQSTKARMLAKLKGKNQTVEFNETTEKELQLRLKDQDHSEATKIRNAMSDSPEAEGQPRVSGNDQNPQQPAADAQKPPQPQEGKQPPQSAPQEGGVSDLFHSDLLKAVARQQVERAPVRSLRDNAYHDSGLEKHDYSQYDEIDDPKFAKALAYGVRYGEPGNE